VVAKIKDESAKNKQEIGKYSIKSLLAILGFAVFDFTIRYFELFNVDALYDFFLDVLYRMHEITYNFTNLPYYYAR
jgi:hypothetical protein